MNGCGHNLVLIETYWNVKINYMVFSVLCKSVLIETYWNVKDGTEAYPITSEHVLIETYWNVKSRKL